MVPFCTHSSRLPKEKCRSHQFDEESDLRMTKLQVLIIFDQVGRFLKPDEVLARLPSRLDRRSLYSYLGRLRRQGLLERDSRSRRGQLAYRLTPRGQERLAYLRERPL